MNRICLDTSAYSHFHRGHAAAVTAVTTTRDVLIPVIVLGELRTGFRLGRKRDRNESELQRVLSHPVVRVVDDEASSCYADLVADLRRAGSPVPTNDVWIAALALWEGAVVLTYDEHFKCIRGVRSLVLSRDE